MNTTFQQMLHAWESGGWVMIVLALVALIGGAIFLAMVVESVAWDVMLIAGLVLAVVGTVAYIRTGMRQLAAT